MLAAGKFKRNGGYFELIPRFLMNKRGYDW